MSGRPRMLEMFNEQFPRFAGQLDRNKLYTRRRAILSHNMLSPAEIEAIKLEVHRERRRESGRSSDMSRRSSSRLSASFASERRESIAPPPDPVAEPRGQEPAEDQRGQLKNELAFHMDAAVNQFYGTHPLTRHKIPKLQYSHRLTSAVQVLDQEVLPVYLEVVENLEELQFIVYCGAVAVVRTLGMRTFHQDDRQNRVLSKKTKPAWMRRLEGRIQTLRVKIGRLTQYKRGSRPKRLIRGVAEIVKPVELSDLNENRIIEILDTHVQRLSALSKRLRRYTECTKRHADNRMFSMNEREFYSRIKKKRNNYDGGLPEIDEVTQFWSGLWENPIQHRSNRMWLAEEEEYGNGLEAMPAVMVIAHDINETIRYSRNWTAPGPDFVHNFWYKKFSSTHGRMAECFNKVLENPQTTPEFVTRGITHLMPKDQDTANAAKYRPITCLTSLYKLLMSVINRKNPNHCDVNEIITGEQKGCKQNTRLQRSNHYRCSHRRTS
ncbi:uncharacterized protein LOC129761411 [Toxorhynchites rutilus septentrionalis]|uniref:uncharacterized protein LOC129761411 n=1 Tax=Toxorhynchites rutilus septentrionalis TaxID=329112 RepID=UPI002478750E|nr:uncharacterized protein LOC129761411 [Toxorhynchites rutilus septentrionalis]